jgi:spoIIIJ-associated protein
MIILEKKELLEKEALQTLEEALQNNVSVAMRPMLPYERKVVHAFLAQNESVVTESVGIGEERKVIVKPRPLPAR